MAASSTCCASPLTLTAQHTPELQKSTPHQLLLTVTTACSHIRKPPKTLRSCWQMM